MSVCSNCVTITPYLSKTILSLIVSALISADTGVITVHELVNFFKKINTKEILSDMHKVKINLKNAPVFLQNYSHHSVTVFSNAFNINARRAFQNMSIIKPVEWQLQSV